MMPGETKLTGAPVTCPGCVDHDWEPYPYEHQPLPFEVCRSNAGYYIGTQCPSHGPCSRESGYYLKAEYAEADLQAQPVDPANIDYHRAYPPSWAR